MNSNFDEKDHKEVLECEDERIHIIEQEERERVCVCVCECVCVRERERERERNRGKERDEYHANRVQGVRAMMEINMMMG